MRFSALSLLIVVAGCSDYELTAPPAPEDGVIEEEDPVIPDDDSTALAAPIAVCSSNPPTVRPPFESNTFVGDQSDDPEEIGIDRYDWTLISAPAGSASTLGGTGANRTFTADQAGIYTAQLVVTTPDGRVSEPCETELDAVPAQALWIEMYWQHPEDIDLHLLAPGGATDDLFTDCYYMNCAPDSPYGPLDWGNAGAADDPSLDIDDTTGTGPENINIGAPQVGEFRVVVHDHPWTTHQGANDVTVNIYVDGQLEWTGTKSFSGEDTYQDFARIDWPSAVITPL